MNTIQSQRGQSLIMLVLMIAIVLAIVTAASYRLTSQTQESASQQQSVQALAAADAGIEQGLQRANQSPLGFYKYSDLNLNIEGIDTTNSTVTITATGNDFVTPVIQKDQQFTFHVKDFTDPTAPNYAETITMSFHSESGADCGSSVTVRTQPAYEITYIYGPVGNNNVRREVVEPCSTGRVISGGSFASTSTGLYTVNGSTFEYQTFINPSSAGMSDLQLIIIRTLFGSSRMAFSGPSLPSQGKEIKSEARTIAGPSKVVTVYQSLPQIPAEFFVTTF